MCVTISQISFLFLSLTWVANVYLTNKKIAVVIHRQMPLGFASHGNYKLGGNQMPTHGACNALLVADLHKMHLTVESVPDLQSFR